VRDADIQHWLLPVLHLQLIQQLDEELGIEKFRTELESTQVLVRRTVVPGSVRCMRAACCDPVAAACLVAALHRMCLALGVVHQTIKCRCFHKLDTAARACCLQAVQSV
jgi:hypothetical protein